MAAADIAQCKFKATFEKLSIVRPYFFLARFD